MKSRFNKVNLAFFSLTPLAAAAMLVLRLAHHKLEFGLLAFFLVTFALTNLSITCGYHRYFSHRTHRAHRWLQFVYILLGAGAFQGSVLEWAADHRKHHQKVDTDDDPYNINRGFWWAHIGWILHARPNPDHRRYVPDLLKDPLLRWQHRIYPYLATAIGFGLPGLLGWGMGYGWGGLMAGGFLRLVVSHHTTFLVNSMAHSFGSRPYYEGNSARDSFLVAVLTFGEGYHNFHHHWPADYRNGTRWFDWDPSKWSLYALQRLGLVRNLHRVPRAKILESKLEIEAQKCSSRFKLVGTLKVIRQQLIDAQAELDDLAVRLKAARKDRANYKKIRMEKQAVGLRFKTAWNQWSELLNQSAPAAET